MNTAIINVRIDPKIKRQAQKTASEIGVSLSDVINASLREFVEKQSVTFRKPEVPSQYLLTSLKESLEDVKAGRVRSFENPKDALKYLDTMIEYERKSRKN